MIWVDRIAKQIKERAKKKEGVDDMKTPSGRVHVGALRGVIIHDLIYKALMEQEVDIRFTYVFNDMDQMDAVPSYLDQEKWSKYSGMPLCNIPSPKKGFSNFAEYFAKEFIDVFESINCYPEIIWGSKLYHEGKMNDVIREALDNADLIRKLYFDIAKSKRPDDWLPIQPICEKCGKSGTTYAYKWDGKKIWYRCDQKVKWTTPCDHAGAISPFDGNAKLHWKVDWPANWKVIGVTVEGSGKDHMSAGGSYDLSSAISKQALKYEAPFAPGYEWFTIEGSKMSSSKGIGTSAKEAADILPPDLLRFLLVRTPIERSIDFSPFGDTIPNLFDDYDKCMNAYFDKKENKLPEGKQGEVATDYARIFELSQVRRIPQDRPFVPRFRTVVNILKTKTDLLQFFEDQKGSSLTDDEKEILEERSIYAQTYLKSYAGDNKQVELQSAQENPVHLTDNQKKFLQQLASQLSTLHSDNREEIQEVVFNILKKHNFQAKEVFTGFYQVVIGKDFGPKAADLILEFGKDKVIEQLKKYI